MTFDEFIRFRNVVIRNQNHERVVRMFYPYLSSVSGIPESLSKIIGTILGIDFLYPILTGCFNGTPDGIVAPYGIPDLYCRWENGLQVYVYGTLPKDDLIALQDNGYVLFVLSDDITKSIEVMSDAHMCMREESVKLRW